MADCIKVGEVCFMPSQIDYAFLFKVYNISCWTIDLVAIVSKIFTLINDR